MVSPVEKGLLGFLALKFLQDEARAMMEHSCASSSLPPSSADIPDLKQRLQALHLLILLLPEPNRNTLKVKWLLCPGLRPQPQGWL